MLDIASAAVDVGVTTEEIDRIVHEVSQEGIVNKVLFFL